MAEFFGIGLTSKEDGTLVKLGCLLYMAADANNIIRNDKDLDLTRPGSRRAHGMNVLKLAVAGHPTSSKSILPFPGSVAAPATGKRDRVETLEEARAGRQRNV